MILLLSSVTIPNPGHIPNAIAIKGAPRFPVPNPNHPLPLKKHTISKSHIAIHPFNLLQIDNLRPARALQAPEASPSPEGSSFSFLTRHSELHHCLPAAHSTDLGSPKLSSRSAAAPCSTPSWCPAVPRSRQLSVLQPVHSTLPYSVLLCSAPPCSVPPCSTVP